MHTPMVILSPPYYTSPLPQVLKLDIPGVDLDESDFELLGALGRRRLQSLVLEELLQKVRGGSCC